MAVAGLRGTGDWGTDERPKDFREMILFRNPNGSSPLTALMSKMKKKGLTDPEFSWWEEDLDIIRVTVNGAINNVTTALVVDAGATNLVPGDVLLVEKTTETANYDNELVVVGSVASDTAFTIARGQAGSTAAAIGDNAVLLRIGSVFAEGTNAPNSATRNPTKLFNVAQIWKTTYDVTNTAKKTEARTGDPVANDKKRKMFDHSTALEWSALFGKRHETVGSNGKPLRFMGGLLYFLTQYNASNGTKIYSSSPDANTILDDLYKVFDYSVPGGAGDQRLILAGNAALNKLNKAAQAAGVVQSSEVVKVYGMNLTQLVTPQGTFYVKTHPLMNRHPVFSKSMFVIDGSCITWRPLRDTAFKDNIQNNDSDTQKGQWLTEGLVEFNHLNTMKYLGNVV